MSVFGSIGTFFKKTGALVVRAFLAAGGAGLSEEVLKLAVSWVKVAARKELDNTQRREFVVSILVNRGVPESIARLATELAVQLIKKEVEKP